MNADRLRNSGYKRVIGEGLEVDVVARDQGIVKAINGKLRE